MNRRSFVCTLICSLLILSCLGSCNLPSDPPCTPEELTAPGIVTGTGPSIDGITDDLTPDFPWVADYPCSVDGFRVEVALDGDFSTPGLTVGTTGPDARSWTPLHDLETASYFEWRVAAVTQGEIGPFTPSRPFFTGPACGEDQRWSVTLVSPAMGVRVIEDNPSLDWSYPDASCQPEGYAFTVQEQPAGTNALTGNSGPYSGFETNISYLDDCTLYHWWVLPVIGGVTSENHVPSYFITDFSGACPGDPCDPGSLVAPTPLAPADGTAWTGTYPIVSWSYAYPACQRNLAFYIEIAVDPDFAGILVWGNTAGGWMTFDPAAAQLQDCTTYYWHVAASQEGLGPSSETWSFHTDFSGACGRSSRGTISQDAVCRGGPSLDYPVLLYLSQGAEIELTGRNEEATWLVLTRPDGYGECWIGARLVAADDLAGLSVREAPPLVIATAEPSEEPAGPTPTATNPVNCSVLSCLACKANPACIWTDLAGTCVGVCRNR